MKNYQLNMLNISFGVVELSLSSLDLYELVFGGGVLNLLFKMHFFLEMSQISEIKFSCTSGHSLFAHKFLGEKNIFFVLCKKDKKWHLNNHVGA
jgi:hypothetical protein